MATNRLMLNPDYSEELLMGCSIGQMLSSASGWSCFPLKRDLHLKRTSNTPVNLVFQIQCGWNDLKPSSKKHVKKPYIHFASCNIPNCVELLQMYIRCMLAIIVKDAIFLYTSHPHSCEVVLLVLS